ncbi:glutaminase [Corynebacterium auriscanis]|uniref:glutaminase n=2 Tax=Corynebacterium auriscanis TaxID=99807 RepID=UPI003CF6A571
MTDLLNRVQLNTPEHKLVKEGIISDYLNHIMKDNADNSEGQTAQYISALRDADPEPFATALCTLDGRIYSAALGGTFNDAGVAADQVEFTIQSISKPFVYALALQEHGIDELVKVVGMEPSGEAFNELSLEGDTNRPVNPMINAGAITVNQLINGSESTVEDRVAKIHGFMNQLAGRELTLDKKTAESEMESSDRNLALAHMLRSYNIIQDQAEDAVNSYVQQCSILVTVRDLAVMGATLASGGVQPLTGRRVMDQSVARQVQSVMASAGMYNAAGRWMARVGIPAKSGVAGGVLGTLPGQLGLSSFSPKLDEHGNSVRGVRVFQRLSNDMGLHLMAPDPRGRASVRSLTEDSHTDETIVRLQGDIDFIGGERLYRTLSEHELKHKKLVFDMTRVDGVNPVGCRMLNNGIEQLREEGYEVRIEDPEGWLKLKDAYLAGDGV